MEQNLITAYFEADHDRLESLFTQFQKLKQKDFELGKRYFKAFLTGLKRHIVWEEQVLFPLFEEKTGVRDSGPTVVMREEHRLIGAALDAIHNKVRERSTDSDTEESNLLHILGEHNQKEENILYPSLDKMISHEEAGQLFLKIEEIPEDAYNQCCAA